MDDETLQRLAVEALMEEAKVGAQRAEVMGPMGWVKSRESINKRFLHSTLKNAIIANKYRVQRKGNSNENQRHKVDDKKK